MKKQTDYTLLALFIPFAIACMGSFPGCYNNIAPKRYLLEMGYNTLVDDSTRETGRIKGYTIDALFVENGDTISVKGISQAQYDSLNISE